MKQVVIIGADFVPSSRPPALRIRFLIQHLSEFRWQPIIIATDPKYYEWTIDPENERLLPKNLEVIRTPALSAKLTRKVGIGDIGIRSLWYHWRVVSNLCKNRKIDLVFISVPPYISMALGRWVYERFRIPYVIDYIDPWVTDYYWKLPTQRRPPKFALAYLVSRILEPFALRRVAGIVGVSQGTIDSVINRYPWLKIETAEIPYGIEPEDVEYVRRNPRRNIIFNRNDGFLHISYVGVYSMSMQPTVRALLEAVRIGLKEAGGLFTRMRLHFIGTNYASPAKMVYRVLPLIREMGLEKYADEFPNRVAYLDSLQILLDSHALIVIGSEEPHYTASKVFPYILAKKPLLAIFHQLSNVVNVVRQTNAGVVVTFNAEQEPMSKVEEISKYLKEILSQPLNYEPPTRWDAFASYTAKAMTVRLSDFFDKILSISK